MFIHIVWVKEIGRVTLFYITKRLHYMKMGGLPISVLYSFADIEEIIFLLNLIKKNPSLFHCKYNISPIIQFIILEILNINKKQGKVYKVQSNYKIT